MLYARFYIYLWVSSYMTVAVTNGRRIINHSKMGRESEESLTTKKNGDKLPETFRFATAYSMRKTEDSRLLSEEQTNSVVAVPLIL